MNAEIGVRREERALVERLELALGLAHPLEAAEVVVGQPRLDLQRFLAVRGVQRGARRHRPDGDDARPADAVAGLASRTAGTGPTGSSKKPMGA